MAKSGPLSILKTRGGIGQPTSTLFDGCSVGKRDSVPGEWELPSHQPLLCFLYTSYMLRVKNHSISWAESILARFSWLTSPQCPLRGPPPPPLKAGRLWAHTLVPSPFLPPSPGKIHAVPSTHLHLHLQLGPHCQMQLRAPALHDLASWGTHLSEPKPPRTTPTPASPPPKSACPIKLELQLQAGLHQSLRQCWILNPLSKARD